MIDTDERISSMAVIVEVPEDEPQLSNKVKSYRREKEVPCLQNTFVNWTSKRRLRTKLAKRRRIRQVLTCRQKVLKAAKKQRRGMPQVRRIKITL
jgi:hypothetical protein